MARSKRKTPIHGMLANSDKDDKRQANRRLRAVNRTIVQRDGADSELVPLRAVSDVWDMSKDGKFHFDPAEYPQLMRK